MYIYPKKSIFNVAWPPISISWDHLDHSFKSSISYDTTTHDKFNQYIRLQVIATIQTIQILRLFSNSNFLHKIIAFSLCKSLDVSNQIRIFFIVVNDQIFWLIYLCYNEADQSHQDEESWFTDAQAPGLIVHEHIWLPCCKN